MSQGQTIDFATFQKAEEILHVMKFPIRRKIVAHLFDNPKTSVADLADHFQIGMGVASRHLTKLRLIGFVVALKNADNDDGRNNFYQVNYLKIDGIHNLCKSIIETSKLYQNG